MFLMMIQWLRSLYPRQISSCLVWFLFGPGPVLCCFAVLLYGETQIWLGDLRVVFGRVFWFVCFVFRDDLPEFLDHTCPIH